MARGEGASRSSVIAAHGHYDNMGRSKDPTGPPGFSNNRHFIEPVGPASGVVQPLQFVEQAKAVQARWQASLVDFDRILDQANTASKRERRKDSLSEWQRDMNELGANESLMEELSRWHSSNLVPPIEQSMPIDPALEELDQQDLRVDLNDEEGDDDDDEDKPPKRRKRGSKKEVTRTGKASKRKRNLQDWVVDFQPSLPRMKEFQQQAEESPLRILHPPYERHYYLRKTKTRDYNILSLTRDSPVKTAIHTPSDSELTSLVYTITLHPVPKPSTRVLLATRAQTLVVLGSTTLDELRTNFLFRETEEEVEPDDGKTGAVFGIENKLYADKREGRTDYAAMVNMLVDSLDWPARTPQDGPPTTKPKWKPALLSMHDTKIGDLAISVGKPYWYLHNGNCEHIWTVDSIRIRHPSDPHPHTENSSAPYPITTYISRSTEQRCSICDKDPIAIVTLNDELAGVHPALICKTCFTALHGDGDDGTAYLPWTGEE